MKMNNPYKTESQDFKKSLGQLDKGIESLTAMLNKHCSGTVYFGVSDDGEIIGLPNNQVGKETIKKIGTRILEIVKPSVTPHISIEQLENGKVIISVNISGNQRPYSCNGNYRIRIGSENKQIDPDLLGELFFNSNRVALENIESLNQDLTFFQLKNLFVVNGLTIQDNNFEKNMNFFVNNKYNMLAELLSDSNNTSIKVVRFNGTDKLNMLSRNEYGYKCLLVSMKQALEYVKSLNETRVDINSGLERKEIKLFNEHAFEEAWTNACVHNKWILNVPPAIYIFDNRIEIISNGGLPFDYSLEDFYSGISRPVNISLLKIMGQLRLVEQTGHGNLTIINEYGKEAWNIRENSIIVTIPFAFEPRTTIINVDGLSESERKILNVIKTNPTATISQISSLSNLGTTRVGEIINKLKIQGIIERTGNKRSGYWIVK